MNENFSIEKLSFHLDKKNFVIKQIYSTGEYCTFIKISTLAEDVIVSIPSSYPIRISDKYPVSYIVEFTDTIVLKNQKGSEDVFSSLTNYLDPSDADKLLNQIDIEKEDNETLKNVINNYKKQLERLKVSTTSLKYKLAISSTSSFCFINKNNIIECFAVKKSNPSLEEERELYVTIDLESFFNTDNIQSDVNKIYKKLYSMLNQSQVVQTKIIQSKLSQYKDITKKLEEKGKEKERYEKTMNSLNNILNKIKEKEKVIKGKIIEGKDTKEKSIFFSTKSFKVKKLEEELEKLNKFKTNSTRLLSEVKTEYNNLLLDLDSKLSENVFLFNEITSNFVKLGVMKDCKNKDLKSLF